MFAVVRTPATATKLAALAASTSNITIIKGDLTDPESLKVRMHGALGYDRAILVDTRSRQAAAEEVGEATGGKLDYLINNGAAAVFSTFSVCDL